MTDDIQAEIARLTGAIAQHRAGAGAGQHTTYRGGQRGRGGSGRGRGRGQAVHRNAKWVAPGRPGATAAGLGELPSSTEHSRATSPASPPPAPRSLPAPPPVGGFRNKSLVISNDSSTSHGDGTSNMNSNIHNTSQATTSTSRTGPEPSRSIAINPTNQTVPSTPKPPAQSQSVTIPPSTNNVIFIDGVAFVSDSRGNKLIRKTGSTSAEVLAGAEESNSTPKRASVSGTTYIRTKSGNLVSREFARRRKEMNDKKAMLAKKERLDRLVGIVKDVQSARDGSGSARGTWRGRGRGRGRGKGRGAYAPRTPRKSSKLCRFFQKTGQCTRGLTCPYVHSSLKVSICPLFLRRKCPLKASTCLLSHSPNAHRSPHCMHFPNCKNGDTCPYAHVLGAIDRDAAICPAFVEYGWCERGAECTMRHAIECPEFSERGTCSKPGCKFPHILRRRNEDGAAIDGDEDDDDDEEDHGDNDEDDDDAPLLEGQIDWNATRPSKRHLHDEGQGEQAVKRRRRRERVSELEANHDFVTLVAAPDEYEDTEDEEDEAEIETEDGDNVDHAPEDDDHSDPESVDSADLDDDAATVSDADSDHEAEVDELAVVAPSFETASSSAADSQLKSATAIAPKRTSDTDDDSDDDAADEQQIERLLRQ